MKGMMVTENGEEHGLINRIGNSVPDDGFKHMDPETKAKAEKLKKEEHRVVHARYNNRRGKHERLDTPYCNWAGDPIDIYHLIPDQTYDLPMGFVNRVNASGIPVRSELLDANGKPTVKDGPMERIHELIPVSF